MSVSSASSSSIGASRQGFCLLVVCQSKRLNVYPLVLETFAIGERTFNQTVHSHVHRSSLNHNRSMFAGSFWLLVLETLSEENKATLARSVTDCSTSIDYSRSEKLSF